MLHPADHAGTQAAGGRASPGGGTLKPPAGLCSGGTCEGELGVALESLQGLRDLT